MKNFKYLFILLSFGIFQSWANAQANCIKVDQIAKWEVLDYNKTVTYDSQGNAIAFIIFDGSILKRSGESFRFFSPTICRFDRVQISSGMATIYNIEPIRR